MINLKQKDSTIAEPYLTLRLRRSQTPCCAEKLKPEQKKEAEPSIALCG